MTIRYASPLEPVGDPWLDRAEFRFETGERLITQNRRPAQFDADGNYSPPSRATGKVIYCECGGWFFVNNASMDFCSEGCADVHRKKLQAERAKPHNAKRSEKAAQARAGKGCKVCGTAMNAASGKRAYCSDACRQKAYRQQRGPVALATAGDALQAEREALQAERDALQAERATVAALLKEAREERERVAAMRGGLTAFMTKEEYRLIRGLLHPDRHPEDAAKYGQAMVILNRLEAAINPNIPIAVLRKSGWA